MKVVLDEIEIMLIKITPHLCEVFMFNTYGQIYGKLITLMLLRKTRIFT